MNIFSFLNILYFLIAYTCALNLDRPSPRGTFRAPTALTLARVCHVTAGLAAASIALSTSSTPVLAAETKDTVGKPLVFKTGKSPIPNVDKENKTGTKKDKKFLKCLSGCKSNCEQPTGGLAIQRVDCVQDCQDQCCETYEQCSFKINIGSAGL
jgi:hypothetical protein